MSRYRIEIRVTPRPGILDPQGKAIHQSLQNLGWSTVGDVRVGKSIHIEMEAAGTGEARSEAEAMCRKLLANPVTEDFEVYQVEEA